MQNFLTKCTRLTFSVERRPSSVEYSFVYEYVQITRVEENTNIEHNGNNNVRSDWKRATDAAAHRHCLSHSHSRSRSHSNSNSNSRCPVSVRRVSQSRGLKHKSKQQG
ncbi:uncharacterized protein LOC133836872 [Drosophila sulfurigaster albostrigata]|uniref:uncharacterized protein LOC133836872 n=1 Tax=Drosophila sulfurigaster albostrigata TaxID=89887 RepID=UPI002D21A6C1|nr:uncharacterized protein LOC133836872 [Drosophila sulfurigaster albostrigata]